MFSPNGQAWQDEFVLNAHKYKKNGYFLEIGANDAKKISNTYLLEKDFNWTGILVEYDKKYEESYKKFRHNSKYVIANAVNLDYKSLLKYHNFPKNMDYLQIDLEVENKSTLDCLLNLDMNVFCDYKFATITFEHDFYRGNFFDTRSKSREIFEKHGYVRVFSDVKNENMPFEDWYVHPELVPIEYINSIKCEESLDFKQIISILRLHTTVGSQS